MVGEVRTETGHAGEALPALSRPADGAGDLAAGLHHHEGRDGVHAQVPAALEAGVVLHAFDLGGEGGVVL